MKTRHQRLLEPDRAPRDGFPYTDPDTGFTVRGKTIPALVAAATLHRNANGLKVPADFDLYVETQICELWPGKGVRRDGTPPDTTCAHRGGFVRWEGCETCGGVRAKIVACTLHGEATEFAHDVGVRRCGLCLDRVSTLPEDEK